MTIVAPVFSPRRQKKGATVPFEVMSYPAVRCACGEDVFFRTNNRHYPTAMCGKCCAEYSRTAYGTIVFIGYHCQGACGKSYETGIVYGSMFYCGQCIKKQVAEFDREVAACEGELRNAEELRDEFISLLAKARPRQKGRANR